MERDLRTLPWASLQSYDERPVTDRVLAAKGR